MGKELTPEQIEHNKKSVKRTAIICMVIVAIVAVVAIVVMIMKKGGSKSGDGKSTISYEVVSSQEYVRDGKKCMAYRVYVPSMPSYSDAKRIFETVTKDDYYLHTIWFYVSKSKAAGTGSANWTMEETVKGVTPTMK